MANSDIYISIPVVIDSVKQLSTFQMTRCSYFSIECDIPSTGWNLDLGRPPKIPFLMLGLSGIIYQPMGGGKYFDSPEQLEELFMIFDDSDDLYIDVNDIWLPNAFFENKINHERGNVFRVGLSLFKIAYRFQKDGFDQGLIEHFMEFRQELRYCKVETDILREWNKDRVEESIGDYREHPELQLPRKAEREMEDES